MRLTQPAALFCLANLILTVPASVAQESFAPPDRDTLFQVSTIDALLAGVYQPLATLDAVLERGDLGLGTFVGLDGELVLLDGEVYQAAADGTVKRMPGETATPFISLTWFDADERLPAPPGQDYASFKTWLESRFPSPNLTYAIRVDGRFATVRYRSVPAQEPPYPPLKDVEQAFFVRENIAGTLVGFWCPSYVKGLNVPGFHLHFISDDRASAGHLLDFTLAEGAVRLDPTTAWTLKMPMDKAFLRADLSADRAQTLHSVEQAKTEKNDGD